MDLNKVTEKTREAIADAQVIATRRAHQSADEPHLLAALLDQDGGLAPVDCGDGGFQSLGHGPGSPAAPSSASRSATRWSAVWR